MDIGPVGDAKLAEEFDMLAERAGLSIPPERRAAIFAQFKDLRRMVALLRRPEGVTTELASTYQMATIVRSL